MLNAFKKDCVYLDWASAAPVSADTRRALLEALEAYGNPSSPHAEGEKARALLEQARKIIARLAGVKTDGVIFTSSATEANALAIQGHVKARLARGEKLSDLHLLYLPTAHSSVIETMESLRAEGAHGANDEDGAQVEPLVVTNGAIDLDALKKQLRPETVLVSMDAVCGETGTRYNTRDVRRVLDAYSASRIILHVDASQAPMVESIDCNHLGADLLTLDAQKVGAVRGIGALIRTNPSIALAPIMYGGGQEQGLRPGTENPALAAVFAVVLNEVNRVENREGFKARAAGARTEFIATLQPTFPDMTINVGKEFSPHILNISFPNRDTDYAVMLLSKAGFAVSTKSACETDEVGSRVVLQLIKSYSKDNAAETEAKSRSLSTLRISWGPTTKPRELQSFAKALICAIQFLDAHKI